MSKKTEYMKGIQDKIIAEYGYDKANYMPKTLFEQFCDDLCVETYEQFKTDGNIVLHHHHMYYVQETEYSDEKFTLHLAFGYPKDTYISIMDSNVKTHGKLCPALNYFTRRDSISTDLLPMYKELLRERQIDTIIND